MRMLLLLLALTSLVPQISRAGTIAVDPFQRRVDTSRLRVTFDSDDPEILRAVVFKDFDANLDLSADEYSQFEFWGQTLRGAQGAGHIQPIYAINSSWTVILQRPDQVEIEIQSESEDQPVVTTRYTFYADQPYFVVDRTIHYSALPESSSVQAYVPRIAFVSPYRAVRWKDTSGHLFQRVYCASGCIESGWDGHWLQHFAIRSGRSLSIASIYPSWLPQPTTIVRSAGPQGATGEIAPLYPSAFRNQDLRTRLMIAFSLNPDSLSALDSLRTKLSNELSTLAVPEAPSAGLSLSAAPNPSRGQQVLSWSLPSEGTAELALFDVTGRRVAALHAGYAAAGPHRSTWDGRDSDGRAAAPGLYLARLVTSGGTRSARVLRVR